MMERLTERHVNKALGAYMVCSRACINDDSDCSTCEKLSEMVDRLAAYEETGLTPEEIMQRIKPPNEPLSLNELRKMDGEPVWCVLDNINCSLIREWGIVTTKYKRVNCCSIYLHFGDYGLWKAYRRKPEEGMK